MLCFIHRHLTFRNLIHGFCGNISHHLMIFDNIVLIPDLLCAIEMILDTFCALVPLVAWWPGGSGGGAGDLSALGVTCISQC